MNRVVLQFFKHIIFTAGFLPAVIGYAQDSTSGIDRHNQTVLISTVSTYAVSLIGLNGLWYEAYEQAPFHFFNDNREWLQMDKVGHAFSTYALTSLTHDMYKRSEKFTKSDILLYSAGSAFLFLTTIELFDGVSAKWGFSKGDFLANTSGILLFAGQEALFNQQILRLKYSYQNTPFRKIRPNIFGETTLQSAFKDYNGMTYWASFNLNALSSNIKPKWLNLALGYGAKDMLFGNQRNVTFNGENYLARRQYYLSLDVDWSKIETNKKLLKWVFKVANCIKLPAPTIELSEGKSLKTHFLYF